MAVTQQLARVSADYLAACRRSADESLGSDLPWNPPAADCLNLDWAPAMLERVCGHAQLDPAHLDALRRATEGDSRPDVGFLNAPPHAIGPFGPTPTALSAAAVAHVSALLKEIDFQKVLALLPEDSDVENAVIGHGSEGIIGGARPYLLNHFSALTEFYELASGRDLLVVLWWD